MNKHEKGKCEKPSTDAESWVPERPKRRKYSAEYKLRILEEADRCTLPGEQGALLRREGIYSSHLHTWRCQREQGLISGLEPKKRGPKPKQTSAADKRIAELERENRRLRDRLEHAETIIEVQKKVSKILEIPLEPEEEEKS